jgi:hypothetical protein
MPDPRKLHHRKPALETNGEESLDQTRRNMPTPVTTTNVFAGTSWHSRHTQRVGIVRAMPTSA